MLILLNKSMTYSPPWTRTFSDTAVKYEVEGNFLTKEEVRDIPLNQRRIAHWLILVDWDLQMLKPFVVIDPMDPSGLLYLTSHDYLVHTRTLARAGISMTVVARPGTKRPVPQNSPTEYLSDSMDAVFGPLRTIYGKFERGRRLFQFDKLSEMRSDISFTEWNSFVSLRKYLDSRVTWGENQTVVLTHENVIQVTMLWARELLHYLNFTNPGGRIGQILPFVLHLKTLLRHNGPAFVIQRLKISLFAMYSYVGGRRLLTTAELGQRVRLQGGLPTFIPPQLRASIRDGNLKSIRLWASLFYMYRVLNGPHGLPPLENILAPVFKGDVGNFASFCQGINSFWIRLETHIGKPLPEWKYVSHFGKLISSAGANTSQAMSSLRFDLLAWDSLSRHLPLEWFQLWGDTRMIGIINLLTQEARAWYNNRFDPPAPIPIPFTDGDPKKGLHSKLWKLIARIPVMDEDGELEPWRISVSDLKAFREMIWDCYKNSKPGLPSTKRAKNVQNPESVADWQIEDWIEWFRAGGLYPTKTSHTSLVVGRLHALYEAAGKVRIVAIGDYFSQVGLSPLHDYLFSLLRKIPQDATFDQQGAVDAFAAKGYKDIHSYDLKAATDLIPSQLYTEVLEPLIGRKGADLWHSLMKDRKWLSPIQSRKNGEAEFVSYTRGQPMGLLSSWASLAVLHHALVQFAAMRAGWDTWFEGYLVLGDDITIGDNLVAAEYLLVCEEFGIKVGLAKSLISHNGLLNFASQTFLGENNISPISFGEELKASNWNRRMELARRISHRYDGEGALQESNVLRRMLTASQWERLQPYLTGRQREHLLKPRFIEFFLLNPFTRGAKGLNIDHVLKWLGMLVPSLTKVDSNELEGLGSTMEFALLSDIQSTYAAKCKDWKEALASAQRLIGGGPRSDFEGNHYWHYLADCLLARIERFGKDLDELGLPLAAMHPDAPVPTLETLLEWYILLENIPPVANLFTDEPRLGVWQVISAIRKVDKVVKASDPFAPPRPRDTIRGPLEPILKVMARVFGLRLPAMKLALRPPKQQFWKELLELAKEFENSKIKLDSSFVLNERALVVLPPIPVPVVPIEIGNLE